MIIIDVIRLVATVLGYVMIVMWSLGAIGLADFWFVFSFN